MRKAILMLFLPAFLAAGCSQDSSAPSAAAPPQRPTCPAGWKAGWQRLANRVKVPVYCPSWMPSPLDGKIGGAWDNGVSVDPDRSYLVSFLWHEPPSQDVHVNLRGYPGRTRIPRCNADTAVAGRILKRTVPCFSDPHPVHRIAGLAVTPYTVNQGVDQWHVLYAWRRRGTLYTISEHVIKPLTYRQVVRNLDREVAGLVLIAPRA
jgi:hypothetical protein